MDIRKFAVFVTASLALSGTVAAQSAPDAPARWADPIERLEADIKAGAVTIPRDSALGYLPGLLDALDIPVSSQALIFSRTSLQTQGIAPWAPRAVYFNDDVYIGYVQESTFIEVATVNPTEGGVFYTLGQESANGPQFQRETTTCLMCHESRSTTGGVPGFIIRSVLTDRLGYVIGDVHSGPTTDRTPQEARWGGWYVTGSHGDATHAGNTKATELSYEVPNARRYLESFDMGTAGNLTELREFFDPTPYLSPYSDIVALMVLTHQVQVHNYIALLHAATRDALRDQSASRLSQRTQVPADSLSPTARVRIEGAATRLVRELLFARATPLPAPVQGTSGFAEEWVQQGPRDSQDRSLRDFDLETRLFRHPLSFLVYSDAFKSLPEVALGLVYTGIADVLTGANTGSDFEHLAADDRAAILEIFLETSPEFAAHFGES